MKTKSQTYKDALDAWGRGDMHGVSASCADDVEWYPNRSMRPVKGKAAMLEFMVKFGAGMSSPRYTQTLMVEQGNLLFVEGIESYTKNGRQVSVPYAGVLEFRGDEIVAWRDYFDLKSLEKQLSG
jgi:limonene-1,2-epoxide hydrolase